jgi:hypothetical protein
VNKKSIILLAIGLVFLFSACKGQQEPVDVPAEPQEDLQAIYQQLQEAQKAFCDLDAGVLRISAEHVQKHIEAGSDQHNEYRELIEDTVRFRQTDLGYDFIQIIQEQGQDVPMGFKQENGVYTLYNYTAYQDGTFEWREAAAEKNHYELPDNASLFRTLEEVPMIQKILVETEGDMTVYELIPDEAFFDTRASLSSYNGYSLDDYRISYYVDQEGLLRRVVLSQTESWIYSEMYNTEQTLFSDIELISVQDEVDMDHFRNSSTYVRPVYDEVTEIWREEFINIPETYLFDVRIPRLRGDLPNAKKINDRIGADCNMELNVTPADLTSQSEWGGYPWYTADFSVTRFGDIYQICIFKTEASAWGSGVSMWMNKYYYDAGQGDVLDTEDFLAYMNYTPQEIEEIFYRDYIYEASEFDDEFTYDQISDWFYLDENANVKFYVNLYG